MRDFSCLKKLTPLRFDGASYKYAVRDGKEIYILKFEEDPRRGASVSHTNHHVSEYIGSHIYQSIGIPAQDTLLVKRNDKMAVACKNFCQENLRLYSFKELATDFMHPSVFPRRSSGTTTLEDTLQLISMQTIFPPEELVTRYWEMFVADSFIANPDRHNGNWGYLVNTNTLAVSLAPVYDCGASLYPAISEKMMAAFLSSPDTFRDTFIDEPCATVRYNGAKIRFSDFYRNHLNSDFAKAVRRIVPLIDMSKIADIIDNTPGISDIRKEFLLAVLTKRKERILEPALEKALRQA